MNKQILPNIVDFLHTAVYWHIIGASTDYGHTKAKSQSNNWHVDIVESHDLSQADKSIMRLSSFPKLSLNDKIYN